jgi:uncharacterized SAM-binding protein YcdF (DUF218 family)
MQGEALTNSDNNEDARKAARSNRTRILIAIVAAVLFAGIVVFLGVGRWLDSEDPLEKAQAIAVLSGRMPLRAIEAAKLYREGYAPKVWLTRSVEPGATLDNFGIAFLGEDSYNKQVLLHESVPADAIRVLDPPIVNTADEIIAISKALGQENGQSVIIVTSKVHTRRTRILWRKLNSGNGRAIVRGASADPFEPGKWWKTTRDALDVIREVLGILNAWAGLPLQPAA